MRDTLPPAPGSRPETGLDATAAETMASPKIPLLRKSGCVEEEPPSRLFLLRSRLDRFCGCDFYGRSVWQAVSSSSYYGVALIHARNDLYCVWRANTGLNVSCMRHSVRASD